MATPSKIPLRGIADLFNHLDPGPKAQIQAAFAEAEDYINYSNVSVVGTQDKRKLSAAVAAPVVTTSTNNMGFDVQWDRLTDRRVSSYEVQVSFDSIFSNPDTYQIVNTSFSLEGIGTTVFVRVRGVRFNGECGPWSDSAQIDAFAQSAGPITYSRDVADVPSFYVADPFHVYPHPIQRINITPQRQNGGIVVFGSIGFDNGGVEQFQAGDFIKVFVNDNILINIDLHPGTDFFQLPTGIGFGPTFLSHGDFYTSTISDLNSNTVTNSGSHGANGTHVGWSNLTDAQGTMDTVFPGTSTTYQVSALTAGQSATSKDLNLQNFGFTVPSGNTINGIKVSFTGQVLYSNLNILKSFPYLNRIRLFDETGTTRTFSQVTDFPWPGPTPEIPGNPIEGITVGGATDLWGEAAGFWTPAKINDADFGVNLRSRHRKASSDTSTGTSMSLVELFGIEVTVYSSNPASDVARIDVFAYSPTNVGNFTTLANCTLNVIEFGSAL